MTASKKGGYLTLQIRLLNGRLFNRLLANDGRALYSAEQGKILSSLWIRRPQTATDLASSTGLANNTLTSMLKRLVEQDLITCSPHPNDKRKRLYDLTELGLSQEEVGEKVSQDLANIFYKDFSEQEIEQVESLLERIYHNLEDGLQRERKKERGNR